MSVTIDRLGHHGDGIAAGPIFVPLTLPGEVVEGDLTGDRIEVPRIVTPSSDRVRPPCPHFKSCGGCSLQHASDTFLQGWKQDVVITALAAQNLSARFRPIHVSPPRSRRRATLSATRTKKGAIVGFHARKSDTIVQIGDCFVLHPDLFRRLPVLEEITKIGASRAATVSFALTLSDDGIDCAVTGGKPLDATLQTHLPAFADSFARLTWDGETVFTRTAPVQTFGSARVVPPPAAFLQATKDGELALTAAITDAVGDGGPVLDLFAGCGTFTFPLAARAPVHAVEGDAALTAALDHGVRHATGLKAVTVQTRDLYRRPLLPDELARYGAAVIDPPRAGAEAQMRELARTALIPRIAMVSCNPVTFARDTKILIDAGYVLDWVQVVDQFRWSPHVELVASLVLPHMQAKASKGRG